MKHFFKDPLVRAYSGSGLGFVGFLGIFFPRSLELETPYFLVPFVGIVLSVGLISLRIWQLKKLAPGQQDPIHQGLTAMDKDPAKDPLKAMSGLNLPVVGWGIASLRFFGFFVMANAMTYGIVFIILASHPESKESFVGTVFFAFMNAIFFYAVYIFVRIQLEARKN